MTFRRREASRAEGQQLSVLTVRMPKELHVSLWQMKIIRRVNIETFIQDAIREKLGRMDP